MTGFDAPMPNSHIPEVVRDLLSSTRFGISFPDPSGCQMRFIQGGVNLGGFYSYSRHGGVREAVISAIRDNMALRGKYDRGPGGRLHFHSQREPRGSTGVLGVSGKPYYDPRRDTWAFRYQVSWHLNGVAKSKIFHLSDGCTTDHYLHAYRTAIQFRKRWETHRETFDPSRFSLWRTRRLYEPGEPLLPDNFWNTGELKNVS